MKDKLKKSKPKGSPEEEVDSTLKSILESEKEGINSFPNFNLTKDRDLSYPGTIIS